MLSWKPCKDEERGDLELNILFRFKILFLRLDNSKKNDRSFPSFAVKHRFADLFWQNRTILGISKKPNFLDNELSSKFGEIYKLWV